MDKRIWIIFLIMFTNLLGVGIIFPFLPYYAEHLGANSITIGLLAISYPVFSLLSAPILGKLSDQYGRRPILLFSVAGTVIGFLVLGYAKTLPLLFLSRIIDGASAGNTPTAFAYIADITNKKERTHAISIISSSFWSGISVGFIIGGLLSSYGQSIPAYTAAGITSIGLLLAYFFLPESYMPRKQKVRDTRTFSVSSIAMVLHHPIIRSLLLLVLIREIISWSYDSTASLFTEHFFHATAQQVGFLFAYIAIIGTVVQIAAIKPLLIFMHEQKVIILCFLIILCGFSFLAFGKTIPLFLIGTTFGTIGCAILSPVFTSLISKSASKHDQGKNMGILQTVTTTGSLLGPLLALYLYGLQIKMQYYAGIILAIFAILTYLFALTKSKIR